MKNKILITLLGIFIFQALFAQSNQSVQKEALAFLAQNEQAILSLANEIPEDKYDWRPSTGVRSINEAILHVASGNYFILMNLGIAPPPSVDMMTLEKIKGKSIAIETVKASFKFVNDNLMKITDASLPEKVKFPWGDISKHSAMFLLVDHSGEHKGQLIAYARSVGVTPPWSK